MAENPGFGSLFWGGLFEGLLSPNMFFFLSFFRGFWHSRQKPDSTWIRVFCCIFCVQRKQVMVMHPDLKKGPKSGPTSSKIDACWTPCLPLLLGRGPNASFFASSLSKIGFGFLGGAFQLQKAIFGVPTWPQLRH